MVKDYYEFCEWANEANISFWGKTIVVTTSVVACHCERNEGRCAQEKKPVHRFRRLPQIFLGKIPIVVTTSVVACHCERSAAVPTPAGGLPRSSGGLRLKMRGEGRVVKDYGAS